MLLSLLLQGVTPCILSSTEAKSRYMHWEGAAHIGAWLVSPDWATGWGRVGSRARLYKTILFCHYTAHATLALD